MTEVSWIQGIIAWQKEENPDTTWDGYLNAFNWISHVADGGNAVDFWDKGKKSSHYIWVRDWVNRRDGLDIDGSDSESSDEESSD